MVFWGNLAAAICILKDLGPVQESERSEIASLHPPIRGSGGNLRLHWGEGCGISVHLDLLHSIHAGARGIRALVICPHDYRDHLRGGQLPSGLRAGALPLAPRRPDRTASGIWQPADRISLDNYS